MEFMVYIPTPGGRTTILPGSGIVASPEGNRLMVDFEGDRYGSDTFKRYADRVSYAAGRHADRYPTVARQWLEPSELQHVGFFDDERGLVSVLPEQRDALAEWIGVKDISSDELESSGMRQQMRREVEQALASDNPVQQMMAREMARRYQLNI